MIEIKSLLKQGFIRLMNKNFATGHILYMPYFLHKILKKYSKAFVFEAIEDGIDFPMHKSS